MVQKMYLYGNTLKNTEHIDILGFDLVKLGVVATMSNRESGNVEVLSIAIMKMASATLDYQQRRKCIFGERHVPLL
jgi:hypothetical protein